MKILVIRFSSIGDIVLCSPVVRALHQQQKAEVVIATKKQYASLWKDNPHVSKVISLDEDWSSFVKEVKAEQCQAVLDLHNNFRSRRLTAALQKVKVKRFKKINFKKWLFTRWHIDKMPDLHVVDRYFEAAKEWNVKADGKGLDFFLSKDDEIPYNELPERYKNGFTALVVGAKWATKQIPTHILAALIDTIEEPVILLGGPEDRERGMEVNALVRQVKAYNACGRLSIHESAYILKRARSVITPDTGLMHIASAFKTPTVVVWGNTHPKLGMYPYQAPFKSALVEGLSCHPCSKIGYNKCPKKHFNCMNNQKVDQILSLRGLLLSS